MEEGYINISMNASPVFENGQAEGNLMIVNETVNRYPQQVVITLNDTGETIYISAMFHSLDPDTGAILGSAGANITITIQN